MDVITLSVEIPEDRHLILDLPASTPVGTAQITIQPQVLTVESPVSNPAREAARTKLLAAGKLVTTIHAPRGAVALSNEELAKLGQLPPGAQTSEDLINEDRGEY